MLHKVLDELEVMFNTMLNNHPTCQEFINPLVGFASKFYEFSKEIVEVFVRKYQMVITTNRPHQLIDVIDTIIKCVQGDYIKYFQEKMSYLFPLIWQRETSTEERVKLLKIFKIWDMFFSDKQVLKAIEDKLELAKIVSQ